MALQNIGAANKDDAFYRYKMPKMVTKIEGRGNGIKTNIVNMIDMAKALEKPACYITKYFGYKLGAQSKFDQKTGASVLNGAHATAKLADILESFIKSYVQCYDCGNPETEILITPKTQLVTLNCAACGFISSVDMKDKLIGFIVKNPPEPKKFGKQNKMVKTEKVNSKKSKKKKNGSDEELSFSSSSSLPGGIQGGGTDVVSEEEEEDSVQWETDTSAEAAQKRMKEQLSDVTAGMVVLSTEEKKVAKPKKKDEKAKLVLEIKNKLKEGIKPSELNSFLAGSTGPVQLKIKGLFEALFDGSGKGFAKEVAKKGSYLLTIVNDEDEESQMCLLRALETFSEKCTGEALKEIGLAAKALYDGDVLKEEVILKWYDEGVIGANKGLPVWKNMEPFVEWLRNAESESDEE